MPIDIVEPDEPAKQEKKLVRIYKPLPLLPREESMRMRRAARNMADSLLPWAVQQLAELAESCEDPGVKHKVLMDLVKISLSGKSNEEVDPDSPSVDGSVVEKELAALEKATEKSGTDTDGP